jgi:outer membrane protein
LTLKQILQLPTSKSFDVDANDSIAPVALVSGLNDAQQAASSTRPEVKSSEVNVKVQQTELEKAKYSLRPSLTLGGSLYTAYSDNKFGSTTNNAIDSKYLSQIDNNFYQNLGLTLSIPLFDRNTRFR